MRCVLSLSRRLAQAALTGLLLSGGCSVTVPNADIFLEDDFLSILFPGGHVIIDDDTVDVKFPAGTVTIDHH